MAWNAQKIGVMLKSLPSAKWHPPTAAKMTSTSPRQLSAMEKSGVGRG
jgi:hypothetical protein